MERRLPVGAELHHDHAHFRVWAPRCSRVAIEIEIEHGEGSIERSEALEPEVDGYWSALVRGVSERARYRYRLDDDPTPYPDPASRYQPLGPHGPSELVDPTRFQWTDKDFRGPRPSEAVIYEMHIGTFTREGTWRSAVRHLKELAELGITVIEMMPIADFPGRFGWGYDGVNLFAPYHEYGAPDDLRYFIDRAHAHGIAVILDVVYNHLGPDGNYLPRFAPEIFSYRDETKWGNAINFDGPGAEPNRVFFRSNAKYWIEEHHFDGLRIDATQAIFDISKGHFSDGQHILYAIAKEVRKAAGHRTSLVIGENEPQNVGLLRPSDPREVGFDALWNDDFHHSMLVALTGRNEAYRVDHHGSSQELLSAAKHGFLFQGQRNAWQSRPHGTSTLGIPSSAFVTYLENHDQIANSEQGHRIHQQTSASKLRAATALLLLGPGTPMLFQGQEFLASSPFVFFADHETQLAEKVRKGRHESLLQFASIRLPEVAPYLPDPADEHWFERCKLDHSERDRPIHTHHLEMIRRLLSIRHHDSVLNGIERYGIDGAVLDSAGSAGNWPRGPAFLLRYDATTPDQDRLVIVNLGGSGYFESIAEPLMAPPRGYRWIHLFSSEDPDWGGRGSVSFEQEDGIHLTAECTMLLGPALDPRHRFLPADYPVVTAKRRGTK
jgi:maltooligosyltrehalose trehalohydrolase